MTRALKVYGGCYDGRSRIIVAASTKKEAHAKVQNTKRYGSLSYYGWNEYTSDTGNEDELRIALADPGAVFEASMQGHNAQFTKIS